MVAVVPALGEDSLNLARAFADGGCEWDAVQGAVFAPERIVIATAGRRPKQLELDGIEDRDDVVLERGRDRVRHLTLGAALPHAGVRKDERQVGVLRVRGVSAPTGTLGARILRSSSGVGTGSVPSRTRWASLRRNTTPLASSRAWCTVSRSVPVPSSSATSSDSSRSMSMLVFMQAGYPPDESLDIRLSGRGRYRVPSAASHVAGTPRRR